MNNFTTIPVKSHNVDRWIIRTSILEFIRGNYPIMKGKLLDVGCGRMPYRTEILEKTIVKEYVGLDIEGALIYDDSVKPDITWDGVYMPLLTEDFDCVLATEVLEHIPDIAVFLAEVNRVMKPGAVLCFTTPFLWPYHEVPHDRQRWTAFGLEHHFIKAGFGACEIVSHGNWHSALAQFLGLWVARSPMNRFLRRFVRLPIFAVQRILMQWDSDSNDDENSMPRMITGIVTK